LAYRHYEEKKTPGEDEGDENEGSEAAAERNEKPDEKEQDEELGATLKLRLLADDLEISIEYVTDFSFSEHAPFIAYAVSAPGGQGNGAFVRDLREKEAVQVTLHAIEKGRYTHLTWAREATRLAFAAAVLDDDGEPGDAGIWIWSGAGEATLAAARENAPEGYTVPSKNELRWSRDGGRLFFGFKPIDEDKSTETSGEGEEAVFDPYDFDALLEKREVDVWHWNDPLIIPNQKERWEEHEKDRVYRAVIHLDSGKVVPLADPDLPQVQPSDNGVTALGGSDVPYLRELTWEGHFADLYVVDLATGDRRRVAERLAAGRSQSGSLSPDGRCVIFYDAGDWHLYDVAEEELTNLTSELGVEFANEDHDYPSDPPGYGQSEWFADSSSVFIYDKYDIWQVFTDGRSPKMLTAGQGRTAQVIFRVIDLDPEEETLSPNARLLLTAYDDRAKHDSFFAADPGGGLRLLYGTRKHKLRFEAKAEDADRILFTRERYDEFPDLWISDLELQKPKKLSDANPEIADFAWGSAELVEWSSLDGTPLQGVLIRPGNYEPGKRYPVLVYFYRFFSQRLNEFNQPVVNHRPSFPVYASNGYAVFLPDIRFEIGQPGFSATKCLVPGVQKLVDMGVADPDAVGLHGHSWSGYQTAFVITQTDIFAAAVAGAPVSNMTSAYSGIRWGTGLARQFQYEKAQSRIGGSLWEYPERYVENSPVFFADRINTPLLIEFGDEDGAVPWYQGIELYLACRRLDKDCVFLQYRGEPHHLKKYANKLDYSIKMKQFFDHHLKGEEAPTWMTEGVPYQGK
jgi:dipeptidyl aminopeptidase/acylaminoacyl peptidase